MKQYEDAYEDAIKNNLGWIEWMLSNKSPIKYRNIFKICEKRFKNNDILSTIKNMLKKK